MDRDLAPATTDATRESREFFACLALKHAKGIGPRTHKAILEAYPSAFEAVRDARNWRGLRLARADQVKPFLAEAWRPDAEFEYRAARMRKMRVLCWGSREYPELLRHIPDPPLALYYAGDLSLLSGPALAVVGSRLCTRVGLMRARQISGELSACGLTIVSGLARGIDREAHQGGLSGVGSSIAVVGAGLDHDYPVENLDVRRALERHGLVLSEFAPGTIPDKNNFPYRNRIISGLSLGVLVAEAARRSGSLITARLAGEQGREVFALSGDHAPEAGEGCEALIEQGAILVHGAEDILRELMPALGRTVAAEGRADKPPLRSPETTVVAPAAPAEKTAPAPPAPAESHHADLDADERAVLDRLAPLERRHIDELCRALEWESGRISTALAMLEVKGLVRQWPGMHYTTS